jgi:uncharacterized protein (DUF433 family)
VGFAVKLYDQPPASPFAAAITAPSSEAYILKEARQMAQLDTTQDIDWTQCELIECIPGKVSGRPVVRGTRIMPEAIVGSFELGESIEELHAGFPTLSVAQIQRSIEYAQARRERHRP